MASVYICVTYAIAGANSLERLNALQEDCRNLFRVLADNVSISSRALGHLILRIIDSTGVVEND